MSSTAASIVAERPRTFSAPISEWRSVVLFCLMLSLLGLRFYPIPLVIAMFLLWQWRQDRYFFIVEVILFMGGYGFTVNDILPVKLWDFSLILGVIGFIIYRKHKVVARITLATLAYFAVLFYLASTSVESMSIQFQSMRRYLVCITYFLPLLIFANKDFDWDRFLHVMTLHILVICGFYVIDTLIFNGFILLPAANPWDVSTFASPIFHPFSFTFPRHYPQGLYWLFLLIPVLNSGELRFSKWQWLLVVLAVFCTRTNSLLFALIVCFVCFRPNLRQVALYGVIGVVGLTAGYFVDRATGRHLRLADNIEQFTSLEAAQDDEDLAEFGTGRMAQILPKWQLLSDMDRMAIGFGFLHPTKTTNPIFQINNQYYSNVAKAEETATGVEVTQVQTILDCGWIGLLVQAIYFFGIYFMIRKMRHAKVYLCAIVGMSVLGIGGFAGFQHPQSLLLIALSLAAVIMSNRPRRETPKPEIAQ